MTENQYTGFVRELDANIQNLNREAFALNDFMAKNPEISGQETDACKKICALLEAHGVKIEPEFAGIPTAFKGTVIENAASDVKIGILTEYDALPEIGHGCGHCASGSLSVLTALAIKKISDLPPCNIDIIGTPDEENIGSKVVIADQGVFDDYSFTIMIHMSTGGVNIAKLDLVALTPYYFKFKGLPAHASVAPWDGKNALNGAMLMLHAVDMMRQHILPSTRIHSIITDGGDAPNVVPEKAVVDMIIRSPEKYYLTEVDRIVKDCAKGAAIATQTELEVEQYGPTFDSMLHVESGVRAFEDAFKEIGLPVMSGDQGDDMPASSSDVGNVSFRCPTFQAAISIIDDYVALHTKELAGLMTTEDTHKAITNGAKVIGRMILKSLTDEKLIPEMKREFKEKTVK